MRAAEQWMRDIAETWAELAVELVAVLRDGLVAEAATVITTDSDTSTR
jgi:hypothetical protein